MEIGFSKAIFIFRKNMNKKQNVSFTSSDFLIIYFKWFSIKLMWPYIFTIWTFKNRFCSFIFWKNVCNFLPSGKDLKMEHCENKYELDFLRSLIKTNFMNFLTILLLWLQLFLPKNDCFCHFYYIFEKKTVQVGTL